MNYPTTQGLHIEASAPCTAFSCGSEAVTIPEKLPLDWGIASALFVGACLYLRIFYAYTNLFSDEGIILQGAQRILQGQVPYRDFFSLLTPGSYYWTALLFRIFGSSILVARGALVAYGGFFSLSVYLIARRVCPRSVSALVACLTTVTCLPYYFMALHNWDSTLWACFSLYAAMRCLESGHWVWPALAGLFTAFTCLTEQSKGAGLVLGLGLGLILANAFRGGRKIWSRRRLAAVVVGFASPVTFTSGYLAAEHALQHALADWLWPLEHYSATNKALYGQFLLPIDDVHRMLGAPWPQGLIVVLTLTACFIVPALPIFAVGFLGFAVYRFWHPVGFQERTQYYVLVSTAVAGLLLATLATGRPDLVHIMVQAPLFMIILAWMLGAPCRKWRLLGALQPIAAVLVAASFAMLGSALLWPPLSAHYSLRTRRGVLKTVGPDEPLQELEARVQAGRKVFIYPSQPLYYYLSGNVNPTRYDPLFPAMSTAEQFEDAVREVDADRTAVVLFEPAYIDKIPESRSSMPVEALAPRDVGVDYILAHYRVCETLNSQAQHASFVFMVRKDLSCVASF